MKNRLYKSLSVLIVLVLMISALPVCVGATISTSPSYSLSILSESDTQAVVSVNLESGKFENVTFYLLTSDKISGCTAINKSDEFSEQITNAENNDNTVLFISNPDEMMVTLASTYVFSNQGSYIQFILTKSDKGLLTQNDVKLSVSDIGATYTNKLPLGYGDVNLDNQINSADSLLIMKYLSDSVKLTDTQLYFADVDGNCIINTSDAYFIAQYFSGEILNFNDIQKSACYPVFSLNTVNESSEQAVISLTLDSGCFCNASFEISVNSSKISNITVSKSECISNALSDATDNGGVGLFCKNGNKFSIVSTENIDKTDTIATFTLTKSVDEQINADDVTITINDIDYTVNNNIEPSYCDHEYTTEFKDATAQNNGYIKTICTKCGLVKQEKVIPKLLNNLVIDGNVICGLKANLTKTDFINNYFYSTTAEINFDNLKNDKVCTGTKISITNYNDITENFTVIIYGDVNCDGQYDGTDAVIVNCIANGMLTKDNIGEYAYKAADCNHDGNIDENDVTLLTNAGILLDKIEQSKDAVTVQGLIEEYNSIIEQSADTSNTITSVIKSLGDLIIKIYNLIKLMLSILY